MKQYIVKADNSIDVIDLKIDISFKNIYGGETFFFNCDRFDFICNEQINHYVINKTEVDKHVYFEVLNKVRAFF